MSPLNWMIIAVDSIDFNPDLQASVKPGYRRF